MSEYPPGGPGSAPPPPNYGRPTSPGTAPQPVQLAVKLIFGVVALSVLSLVILFAQMGTIRDQVRAADAGLTDAQIDAAVTTTVVVAVFFGLVFAALYLWLAFMIRRGANWARITLTVLFILGILFGLVGITGNSPAISKVISVINLVLEIAILVLMWRRESSEYFALSSQRT
jgi:hypothetical protein